ncbi:Hypp417 [Branchiostoma lanceolatum]|uniref:Hypp417 protein n=1 Tax=Branchiostoma lanceolatum TaxID=7740 RepID=A0A8J9W3T0_BRALA|nr:Hypp417 [Branchiostoma lanceolatum]
MPKVKASKKSKLAPGLTDVTIPGPSYPLFAPKSIGGPQTCRDPHNNGEFWQGASTAVETHFTPLFRRWLREGLPESFRPDYGMGTLDAETEETVGNSLLLAGPLIDFRLTVIGEEVSAQLLKRNNKTGLTTFETRVPPTEFLHLMPLIEQYGGQVEITKTHSGMYGNVQIKITSLDVLKRILSGARSDGRNFLMRRQFDSEGTSDEQVMSRYRGHSEVVVTDTMPFQLHYKSYGSGRLKVSFYRQKYDRHGQAKKPVLQAVQNF